MEKVTEMPTRSRDERGLPPRQPRTARRSLPAGSSAPQPGGSAGFKSPKGRDFRPALNDLLQTMSIAGGMMPMMPIQAQSALVGMHAPQLSEGLNIAAHSNKFIEQGVTWLCGKDETDSGGAGIIVALAALAPFIYTTFQLWTPPDKKKHPEEYEIHRKQMEALAKQAEATSRAYIEATIAAFQAEQAAREAAQEREAQEA